MWFEWICIVTFYDCITINCVAVASLTGITDSMLIGKKRFKDVCTKFLHWIDATSNEVLVKTGVCSVPGKTAFMCLYG